MTGVRPSFRRQPGVPMSSSSLSVWMLGALLAAHSAAASDADLLTEADYFSELPVVLSGSRLAQRLEASPVAISVLDRATIEASGAREIQEVLRLVPGMVVGYHDGGVAFVSYHAFGDRFARRMQVMIDGRSVYTPALGGVDWSALPLAIEDIERIEVIRGPNAAAYGANAFVGAINILTRRADPERDLRVVARHGERGVRDLVVGLDGSGPGWGARLTASDWRDQGFVNTDGRLDDKRTRFLDARLDSEFAGGEIMIALGDLEGERTAGRVPRPIDPPRLRRVRNDQQTLRWERAVSVDDSLSLQLYRVREDMEDSFTTLPIPRLGGGTYELDYTTRSERVDFELQHKVRLAPDMRGVWGVSTRLDRVRSASFLGAARPEVDARHWRLFGHGEWAVRPTLTVNAGVMIEHSTLSGNDVSPRLALNWETAPGRAWRTSISNAVRVPVIIEQHADQAFPLTLPDGTTLIDQELRSSGGLDAEDITSWELGYLRTDAERRFTFDARVFYDRSSGLITYYRVPFADAVDALAIDFRNHDRASVRGAEFSIDWRMRGDTRLRLNYAMSLIHSEDIDETYSTSAPRHLASALLTRSLGRTDLSLMWYWQTEMHGLDSLDPMPTGGRVDARLAFRLGAGADAPRLSLVAQAIDGSYDDSRDGNHFEPRLVAELSFGL